MDAETSTTTTKTRLEMYIGGYNELHTFFFGPTLNNEAYRDNPTRSIFKSLSVTLVSFYLTFKFWLFQNDFVEIAKTQEIDKERAYELILFSEPKTNLVVSQGAAILYFIWGSNLLKLGVNLGQNFLYQVGAYFFRGLIDASNSCFKERPPIRNFLNAYLSLRRLFQSVCWLVIAGTVIWKGKSFFNNLLEWDQTIHSIPALNITSNFSNIEQAYENTYVGYPFLTWPSMPVLLNKLPHSSGSLYPIFTTGAYALLPLWQLGLFMYTAIPAVSFLAIVPALLKHFCFNLPSGRINNIVKFLKTKREEVLIVSLLLDFYLPTLIPLFLMSMPFLINYSLAHIGESFADCNDILSTIFLGAIRSKACHLHNVISVADQIRLLSKIQKVSPPYHIPMADSLMIDFLAKDLSSDDSASLDIVSTNNVTFSSMSAQFQHFLNGNGLFENQQILNISIKNPIMCPPPYCHDGSFNYAGPQSAMSRLVLTILGLATIIEVYVLYPLFTALIYYPAVVLPSANFSLFLFKKIASKFKRDNQHQHQHQGQVLLLPSSVDSPLSSKDKNKQIIQSFQYYARVVKKGIIKPAMTTATTCFLVSFLFFPQELTKDQYHSNLSNVEVFLGMFENILKTLNGQPIDSDVNAVFAAMHLLHWSRALFYYIPISFAVFSFVTAAIAIFDYFDPKSKPATDQDLPVTHLNRCNEPTLISSAPGYKRQE